MDTTVQRLLNDKLYDKRKQGALEYISYLCRDTSPLLLTFCKARENHPRG